MSHEWISDQVKKVSWDIQVNEVELENTSYLYQGECRRLILNGGKHRLDEYWYTYHSWVDGDYEEWKNKRISAVPLPRIAAEDWHGPLIITNSASGAALPLAFYYNGHKTTQEAWVSWVCEGVSP